MNEQQTCAVCGVGGQSAPGIIINGHQLRNALEFLAPDNTPEQLNENLVIELHAKDEDFPQAGLYAYHSECPEEGAILLDDAAQRPEQAEGVHVPDAVFEAEFMTWWEEHGQYCRSGGGDYERTFAFQAWRHLYPQLMAARAALAQEHGASVNRADDIPAAEKRECKWERLAGRGMHELRTDELPEYLIWLADNYSDGPHLEGYYGACRESLSQAIGWVVSELARKTNDERVIAVKLDAAPVAQAGQVPQAWLDVQAERRRQVEDEGWAPEHDDEHGGGQMARAAACYALAGSCAPNDETAALLVSLAWPWAPEWWKPTENRRDLVKSAALIFAELERLDRAAAPAQGGRDE